MKSSAIIQWAGLLVVLVFASTQPGHADVRLVDNAFSYSWTVNSLPSEWSTPRYVLLFCDEQTLVWNDVTDEDNVHSGVETYDLTEIDPGVLQVSWKESPDSTGYGVVLTINFHTWAIYGVLVNVDPGANYSVAGGFSFKSGVQVESPLRSCP